MLTFQEYDFFRLAQYRKRKGQIVFEHMAGFDYCRYDEVDYFNYLFLTDQNMNRTRFNEVLAQYRRDNKDRIKVIFSQDLMSIHDNLIDLTQGVRNIACVKKELKPEESYDSEQKVLSRVRSAQELRYFTELYLRGFNSNNRNVLEVSENFRYLQMSDQMDLFFITYKGDIAGVCCNYYSDKQYTHLSGCAVLEAYRNVGLQKKAIRARIREGQKRKSRFFTAWAYEGSISHSNMLKVGFSNYAIYAEGISKPLETLIETREALSQ